MMKDTKTYMVGVMYGFIGVFGYACASIGLDYLDLGDMLDLVKQLAIPFILTEICTAIGVEGIKNLKLEFNNFKEKRFPKKIEQA